MGLTDWLSGSSSKPHPPEPSQDGGFIAPDRSAREQCWEGRDAFFRCLERNGIIDSVKQESEANQKCSAELKQFEKNCASSWVTYFKKKRVFDYQKEQTLKKLEAENAQPLNSAGGASASALRGR